MTDKTLNQRYADSKWALPYGPGTHLFRQHQLRVEGKRRLDAEIAKLKAEVADAAITPEKLRDAAKEYATVTAQAKALGVTTTDAMDTAAIQKAVVDAKMGDAAKDYTADHIGIAFAALAKGVVATADKIAVIGAPALNDMAADLAKARNERIANLANAHRAA